MTRIGVGYGNDEDAFALGRSVAHSALRTGAIATPHLLLAFCSGASDPDRFHQGLRSVVGESTPIVGGSCLGIITADELSYRGFPAAAAAIESDSIRFAVASAPGVDRDEAEAGRLMVERLIYSEADRLLLLFYDSIRVPAHSAPPVLNSSAPLLDGVEGKLAGHVPVFGAGLVDGFSFGPTWQFCGFRLETRHAVGCLMSGSFTAHHCVMHGCIPLDGTYHRITRMQGDTIYELDGEPVVQVIDRLYGSTSWQQERPIVRNLTIGVNHGPRYGAICEAQYVNRLITGVTPDGSGIGMFEADLYPGQEIQFMIRDNRAMLQSVRENTPEFLERIRAQGRRPVFALYIDCGGRTSVYSVTDEEEAAEVQRVLREAEIPLLGFYSGVEIAPMLGRSRGLDWTGVLLVLAEDP